MHEPAELGGPDTYPVVDLLRRHGRELAIGAAALVFGVALTASADRGPASVLRSLSLAAVAGLVVKNLSEINQIVAETLLPQ